MKYQYFDDEKKLIVYFENASYSYTLLEWIRLDLCQFKQLQYFIVIDGLESTLDFFMESCRSNQYRLYSNGWRSWCIKALPTLCIVSEEWNDVVTFCEFIGSFNEGQMNLFLVDSNISLELNGQKNEVLSEMESHSFIKIEVLPDGDGIEITSSSVECDFKSIINRLSKMGKENDGNSKI